MPLGPAFRLVTVDSGPSAPGGSAARISAAGAPIRTRPCPTLNRQPMGRDVLWILQERDDRVVVRFVLEQVLGHTQRCRRCRCATLCCPGCRSLAQVGVRVDRVLCRCRANHDLAGRLRHGTRRLDGIAMAGSFFVSTGADALCPGGRLSAPVNIFPARAKIVTDQEPMNRVQSRCDAVHFGGRNRTERPSAP
jgi:hypothetical protein